MSTKTRKLSDLYRTSKTVTFDDGLGEPVTVVLRKLSPIDLETVLRKANARRAKYVTALRDTESPEYQEVYSANIERLEDRDQALGLILDRELADRFGAIESELAEEEEWSEDDHLQGLRDAWTDFTDEERESDEDEVRRVKDELVRFNTLVSDRWNEERDIQAKTYDQTPIEALAEEALKALLKIRADNAWLTELRMSEVWLATRDPDNPKEPYFSERADLNQLSSEVLRRLMTEYDELNVTTVEGKDSAQTQDSSSSSATPSKEETSEVSGPEAVSV